MASWIDFKALRAKIKIEDVLKSYNVEFKVRGDRATAFCPLPGHKSGGEGKRRSPSFSVSLSRNIFQCFSCGAHGNAIDLAAYLEDLDPSDSGQLRKAASILQERFGLASDTKRGDPAQTKSDMVPEPAETKAEDPPGSEKPACNLKPPNAIVNEPLDFELKHLDPNHPYLACRGFVPKTIEHFGLGFCGKGLMAERIAIPLQDAAGKLIGYAGRFVDDAKISDDNPKYRFPGTRARNGVSYDFRKSEFLYGGFRIEKSVDDLIVVEGFASVWWLWQHGYGNVVALMGSSVSVKQAQLLLDLLRPNGRFWIMTDADKAGKQCAGELFFALAPHRLVRWAKLPKNQPTDLSVEELAATLWPPRAERQEVTA